MNRVLATFALLMVTVAPMHAASPGDAIDRLIRAYGDAEVDAMLAAYTPDAVFEDVAQGHHYEGSDALHQMLSILAASHLSMRIEEKRRIVEGDLVVLEYEYVGQLNGAVIGQSVGKTGCPDLEYRLPATTWYRVKNGRIAHQKDFIDFATYQKLQQQMLAAAGG